MNNNEVEISMTNTNNQTGMYNDKEFTHIRNWGIEKIRNESREKMIKLLTQAKTTYKLENENTVEQVKSIELKAFEISFHKVDEVYSKKVNNVLKNLKYLLTEHEDLCEAMMVKG